VIGTRKWVIPGLTCLYVVFLAVASFLPSGARVLRGWDRSIRPEIQNALHVPAYAVLVIIASRCLLGSPRIRWATILVALACCAYGALLEALQALIPGRTGSILDALLNVVGVGVGLAVIVAARLARSRLANTAGGRRLAAPAEPQETR